MCQLLPLSRTALVALFVSFSAIGCTSQSNSDGVGNERGAIYGGDFASYAGVVTVINETESLFCNGTIFAVKGTTGYLLTSAHCHGTTTIIGDADYGCFVNFTAPCSAVWTP